jgi:hypothetical protein
VILTDLTQCYAMCPKTLNFLCVTLRLILGSQAATDEDALEPAPAIALNRDPYFNLLTSEYRICRLSTRAGRRQPTSAIRAQR